MLYIVLLSAYLSLYVYIHVFRVCMVGTSDLRAHLVKVLSASRKGNSHTSHAYVCASARCVLCMHVLYHCAVYTHTTDAYKGIVLTFHVSFLFVIHIHIKLCNIRIIHVYIIRVVTRTTSISAIGYSKVYHFLSSMTVDSLHMTSRPGYRGELNHVILGRVRELAAQLSLPHLESQFAHLTRTDGSWRTAAPTLVHGHGTDEHTHELSLASLIDHTELRPDATPARIDALCKEAIHFGFASVMVNGCHVARAVSLLQGTAVRVGVTVGFPLGQTTTAMKRAEAAEALALGACEVDMVMNVGWLKAGCVTEVYEEVAAVRELCRGQRAHVVLKVIVESCLLSQRELIDACVLCVAAGATFVKTSTGFAAAGATPESVDVMLAVAGPLAQVKVSGGVRDGEVARQYVEAGVRRIGTSSGIGMVS